VGGAAAAADEQATCVCFTPISSCVVYDPEPMTFQAKLHLTPSHTVTPPPGRVCVPHHAYPSSAMASQL